ncbi:hypothetical protein J4P02_22795 [Pseudomonas sp. NFXW11]|uniref:AVAST type 1 anti-phage system protein Avs1c n=1 Tax=Pseudomonas sp. NFXW11 TaxID=2819531 RepID=UPI003CF1CF9C
MAFFEAPATRAAFEERMGFLFDLCNTDRMRFGSGVGGGAIESLRRVRKLPNGRIDLLSIDELARVQANTAHQMQNFAPSLDSGED